MTVYVDRDFRYRFASSSYCRFWNSTPERILGRLVSEVVSPAYFMVVRDVFEKVMKGQEVQYATHLIAPNGERRDISGRCVPDTDPAGEVQGIFVFLTDETQHLRAAHDLRLIADSVPSLIAYVDLDSRFRFVNQAYAEWFGKPKEEIVGMLLVDLIGRKLFDELTELRQEVFGGRKASFEMNLPRADGSVRPVHVFQIPDRDAQGKVIGYVNHVVDMTQLKSMEGARAISEARFRALFEQSPIATTILGTNGFTLSLNDAWERHFETSRSVLEGYNVFADPYLDERGFTSLIHRAMAGETIHAPVHEFDPARSGKPGRARWQEVYLFPIRDSAGKVIEVAAMSIDLTDLMIAHQRTAQSEEKLREAVQARDEFLSVASHELRTPVTNMKLQIQMLKRGFARHDAAAFSPERILPAIDQTDRSLERLIRLINDMLDVSRIQTGRLPLDRQPTDLGEVAREVADRFEAAYAAADMPLRLKLAPGVRGRWDRHRLEQVISNFLSNALRYAPGLPVELSVARAGDRAELRVKDLGPGIAPENHRKIFERFERVASPSEISGLGLGLYIARQIAEAHEGTVRVESAPGKGATFILALPAGEA